MYVCVSVCVYVCVCVCVEIKEGPGFPVCQYENRDTMYRSRSLRVELP